MIGILLLAAVTAGWENVNPSRAEFPRTPLIWRADCSSATNFTVSLRDGAEGCVSVEAGGLRVRKTNADGYILVTAKPFAVKPGDFVRFSADQVSTNADVNYSSGFLRYFGREERLALDRAENDNFYTGGTQTMRAIPCTAPGMKYRKFADCRAAEDVLTPVLVVGGAPSDSLWLDWAAEDGAAAQRAWQPHWDANISGDRSGDRIPEDAFDALLAADVVHTAEVRRIDGFSRLVVDGAVTAPAVYKCKHVYDGSSRDGGDTFAGKSLDGGPVKLMVKEIRLGKVPGARGYWTKDGFDAKGAVDELKAAMRMAPRSLFLIALGCHAYPEYTTEEHPDEVWRRRDGSPVCGNGGSCLVGYSSMGKGVKEQRPWPWVSMASRVWRDDVKARIRELVAELKARGLDKRIVGAHLWGYHDGQMTIPHLDYSPAATAEYARIVAEPGCLSTNYAFACKQMGFRAIEEFAGEFKRALGKPAVVAMWCERTLGGGVTASLDVTAFVRSPFVDVLVTQPSYRERLPAFPTVTQVPCASLHLHGKMFWNEFDLRTYGALESWANSAVSMKSLGHSADFAMWQTVYRKLAGEMDARRMGNWFYDMGGGWFSPPEIVADITAQVTESAALARAKPSAWRPEVAVVVDEANALVRDDVFGEEHPDNSLFAGETPHLGSSGVPYDIYLAEDVLADPSLLDGCRLVVLAHFRRLDARRIAWLERLSARGVGQVYLSGTASHGGAAAIRFAPTIRAGAFPHRVTAAPGFDGNAVNLWYTSMMRNYGEDRPYGSRCTLAEDPGVTVLARYADDGSPALAERADADCLRAYVCATGGLTPELLRRWAAKSGAYAAVDRSGLQLALNGDFLSVHCLRPGRYDVTLPFAARVTNLKSGREEPVDGRRLTLELTAGETCRFALERKE